MKLSSQAKWNRANVNKIKAHAAVRVALRQGKLRRGKCEQCGSLRCDAHHDDYTQPLKVRWLCRRCHQQLHAKARAAE